MPKIEMQMGSLADFLRTVLGVEADEHNATAGCNCNQCQMKRFQVPTAPEGELLTDAIVDALKTTLRLTKRSVENSSRFASDLISSPMSPEAEDIMLQLAIDRILASIRAQHALNALLPEDKRAPADALYDPEQYKLEDARVALAKARVLAQARYDERRREEQAKRDAHEAVAEAQPTAAR